MFVLAIKKPENKLKLENRIPTRALANMLLGEMAAITWPMDSDARLSKQ